MYIRYYKTEDFEAINGLNEKEGWNTLAENPEQTKAAWQNSNASFVAVEDGEIVGYLRGMTDTVVTFFICEMLVAEEYRKKGIGQKLLSYGRREFPETRTDVLATSTSRDFYEQNEFIPFYGFRK
ncbi:GNAT family N-acetyltransferase [Salimicrobium halophilum]|uniref:Acetyltransferase (GNAT) domain-containing protein n=1 Tax=Salimicrobium halophilum TaxID=86666 RepID=A0A1G8RHD2_9BACI|nr:GNAT family N-acetyltransferase [Salimicrobium halophilum]SDJ16514.1 Acetyltransferase (GNAT) domain-containing protein [Salimicrobium halophilum]